jgi:hyaluronoglucosaminidase
MTTPPLGIIEGYFGTPWTWDARTTVMRTLKPHGYDFFTYAPKADACLRRDWQSDFTPDHAETLTRFAADCREADVRFGLGLSPYEAFLDFNAEVRAALVRKIKQINAIGAEELAILFDDMHGAQDDLAVQQAEILRVVQGETSARKIIMCPSYYSDDPVLDRVFGARPEKYLTQLGALLDPAIGIFWTGEEVCSREYSCGHLRRVSEILQRKPVLWDNYPVNDGARMSQFLHIRGATGRPASIGAEISAHAINPALQAHLTMIPAITLSRSYAQGPAYEYRAATQEAAVLLFGTQLACMIEADLLALCDIGLDKLGARADKMRDRYKKIDHPAAVEIVAWLDGAYRISDDVVMTQ